MSGRTRARARGRGNNTREPHRPGNQGDGPNNQNKPAQQLNKGQTQSAPPTRSAPPRQGTPSQSAPPRQDVPVNVSIPSTISQSNRGSSGDNIEKSGDTRLVSSMSRMSMETITCKNIGFDKHGTNGSKINLITNFFAMSQSQNFSLYQYHVDFQPSIDSIGLRKMLLKDHKELIGPVKAFDGMVLFCSRKFEKTVTEVSSQLKRGDVIKITIKYTSMVPRNSPTMLQIYNVIMKRILHILGMSLIGRNYYSPEKGSQVKRHNLDIWPGFSTSINLFEKSILLQADISHKILRSDTVLSTLYELYSSNRSNFKIAAEKKFIGQIVLTRYNNKTYKIDDINWDSSPEKKFTKRGEEISFIEYYKNQYKIDIKDKNQPLLVSNIKKKDERAGIQGPILLIPELCNITGLSDEAVADFNVMKDIAVFTRIPPQQRVKTLGDFMNSIQSNKEVVAELKGWGIEFSKNLMDITARTMQPEKINQGNNKSFFYKPHEAEWNSLIRGNMLTSTVRMDRWTIIYASKHESVAQNFIQTLYKVAKPMGFVVGNPKLIPINVDRTDTYINALRSSCIPGLQLVICIVSSRVKDRYDAIKKHCCITVGVPSQVIFVGTISKPAMLMSVTTKICIQLNCKLGGEAWTVDVPLKDLMVVGYDSYHDSLKKGMSVGGFVASLNNSLTKYYSKCTFQHNSQELLDQLIMCMIGALKEYSRVNKKLPDRILIYRDGVGDGQIEVVKSHEIPQFIEAFKKLGSNYNPRLGFIIVKKRINHRFFSKQGNNLVNPPPGTIIDNDITRSEWYDFFIVSQSVRQGTVTPTSYNVIHDTTGLKADHIQRITYKLCHLYYNWPGTVRVPAPCQYAHKLAFLTGQSLHADAKPELSDKLFYL